MKAATDSPVNAPPILLRAKDAARLCGCGLSLWYQLDATGQNPQPITLNSLKLWPYEHLRTWAANGCPSRTSPQWQAVLDQIRNEGGRP